MLLSRLTLKPQHRENLRARGLSDKEIDWRGYRSHVLKGRYEVAEEIAEILGDDVCQGVPGLFRDGKTRLWTLAGSPGILIPVRDVSGQIHALRIRADNESVPRYTWLSSKTKGGAGSGARAHIPLFKARDSQTLRLTEGELKADIATALDPGGVLAVSVPGVSSWRLAIPVLEHFKPVAVQIAFDMDAWENKQVARPLCEAYQHLKQINFKVEVLTW